MEKVQHHVTKLVPSLEDKLYEDRLKVLNIPSLHHRWQWGNMIQVYKINQQIDHVDQTLFSLLQYRTPDSTAKKCSRKEQTLS